MPNYINLFDLLLRIPIQQYTAFREITFMLLSSEIIWLRILKVLLVSRQFGWPGNERFYIPIV